MGINWNNLGAGLAVWGNVLKDIGQRRREEEENQRLAQTLGQIMAVDTQVQQGQEPLSAQFVEETKPRQLIQDAIPDIMKTLNPEQQVQMFSALRGYKNEWTEKLDNRDIMQHQWQTVQKAAEDPLVGGALKNVIPMLKDDPFSNPKLLETAWNMVQDFQAAPFKARAEARSKVETFDSPEGQELQDRLLEQKREEESIKREMERAENHVKGVSTIAEQARGRRDESYKEVDKAVEQLNKFKTSDEAIQRTEELISKNFPVKSVPNKDGVRLEDEFTADEILMSTFDSWQAAGGRGPITDNMVKAGVRRLIESKRGNGNGYTPDRPFMNQINKFIEEVNNKEDIGTIFHNVAYHQQEREVNRLRRRAMLREVRAMQRIFEKLEAATPEDEDDEVFDELIEEVRGAIFDDDWRYLDLGSLDTEKEQLRFKEEYMFDAEKLSEMLTERDEEGNIIRKINLVDNAISLPVDFAISQVLQDEAREIEIPDTDLSQERGFSTKLAQKGRAASGALTRTEETGTKAISGFFSTLKNVYESGRKNLKGDAKLSEEGKRRLQGSLEAAQQEPEQIERGLKARVDEQVLKSTKTEFMKDEWWGEAGAKQMLINAPELDKEIVWEYETPKGERVERSEVFSQQKKEHYLTTMEEMIANILQERGVNVSPSDVSLDDPLMSDWKKEVEDTWQKMWKD